MTTYPDGLTISARPSAARSPWHDNADAWRVTLELDGRSMDLDFFMGPALCREPSLEDVMECLASDASSVVNESTFEDWAADLGFDTDSRKAESTYLQCVAQTQELRALLGEHFDSVVFPED